MQKKGVIIAIDGPVASGKGTIAPFLAEYLKGFYLPTGVMYRCVVLYGMKHALIHDTEKMIASLPRIKISIRQSRVYLNDEDVTEEVRQNAVSRKTSLIAGIPEVRKALIALQRMIGEEYRRQGRHVIAEGRDIGTVVFPDAEVKLYLTASPAVRAARRLEQLHAQGETAITYTEVFQDTLARDTYDRDESKALVSDPEANGYSIVDSSGLSQEQTQEVIVRLLQKKGIT